MLAGRGARKIRPPRRAANADEVDFETTWATLSSAFREIHTNNASKLSYEELYRHAYRVVLKKKGLELYNKVSNFEKDWLSNDVRNVIRLKLSPNLLAASQFGTARAGSALERSEAGQKLLKELRDRWNHHQLCMSMLADVLMYLDRVYLGDQHRPSIYATALSLFRDCVLRAPADDGQNLTFLSVMNNVILEQIDLERRDETIEHYNIKSCINMLESLYESTAEREDQRLYVTSFEEEFLQASREFYREEAQLLLKESDAGAYCRHTWKRITQEQERCQTTLSTTSQQRIEKVLEEELILNRIRDLIEMDTGVKFMVDNERLQDLSLIFELNKRVDSKTTELTRAMHKIIVAMGTEINNSAVAASQATAAPGKDDAADEGEEKSEEKSKEKVSPGNQQTTAAIKWVDDVLALKDKFDNIWTNAFSEDQPLQTCITRSFTDFINSSSFPRSSEYISLFIDDNMKKGIKGKTENEIDVVLDKAITLLRYVQDKDLFERYYKKHLCRRLLMKKSISDEVEKQMVSKMKMELGNQFTSKLEAMFKDVTVSRDLTANYKSFVEQLGEKDAARVELSIEVLTSMTWPLESMGSAGDDEESRSKLKCIFPSSIEHIKSSFEKFYSEKHSGRTLTWLPNMGSADIKAVFPKVPNKGERRHELNVSTYAMCILMLFNDLPESASLTFEEIQAQTNIPNADLIRNVQSLAVAPKTRILIKSPMSKDVKPTDRFSFNPSFQGRSHRIQIGVVKSGNKVEGTKERLETEKKNNDSRGFCIEAAVVRIMKQRKELPHANLITESISQLSSQFKPDISMIKKRIESLIEREYLERIESAPVPSYRYLA